MPNDGIDAFTNDLMSSRPYDDTIDPMQRPNYPAYINSLTNDKGQEPDISRLAAQRMLQADQSLHDDIQQDPNVDRQTPLQMLIPKMAAGTATKAEKMQFYNLTGTGM